jgi:hypothetical protein
MTVVLKGPWWVVPPGTKAAECRSCRATIYWITTANDRRMPVDVEVDGGYPPSPPLAQRGEETPGYGVSHFATCPYGAQHRRPR